MPLPLPTIERFCNQHKIIKSYIDDLPPEGIYTRLAHDKFSIHETIAYLTRYHYIFFERINKILTEVDPYYEIYKPDEDHEFNTTVAKTTGTLLHEMYRLRSDLLMFLEELSPEKLSRVGTHAVLGRMDINQWVEFFLLHESNQLFKIFKLSGSFWSTDVGDQSKIIHLPRLEKFIDEIAG